MKTPKQFGICLWCVWLSVNDCMSLLKEEGIATGIHYPVPLHLQPAYEDRRALFELPATERAAREVLSLPMYPELRQEQIEAVCNAVTALTETGSAV